MKKVLTSCWFWLMLISIILLGMLLILSHWFGYLPAILEKEIFWVAISAVITFISVIEAVITYKHSEEIRKKQATYNAYNEFKNKVFDLENKISSYDFDEILRRREALDKKTSKTSFSEWNEIKDYLSQLERIATCVNNKIFDVETIYNMGGPFLITKYNELNHIITYKRKQEKRNGVYIEFENMVKSLNKINQNAPDFR